MAPQVNTSTSTVLRSGQVCSDACDSASTASTLTPCGSNSWTTNRRTVAPAARRASAKAADRKSGANRSGSATSTMSARTWVPSRVAGICAATPPLSAGWLVGLPAGGQVGQVGGDDGVLLGVGQAHVRADAGLQHHVVGPRDQGLAAEERRRDPAVDEHQDRADQQR